MGFFSEKKKIVNGAEHVDGRLLTLDGPFLAKRKIILDWAEHVDRWHIFTTSRVFAFIIEFTTTEYFVDNAIRYIFWNLGIPCLSFTTTLALHLIFKQIEIYSCMFLKIGDNSILFSKIGELSVLFFEHSRAFRLIFKISREPRLSFRKNESIPPVSNNSQAFSIIF